MSGRGVGRIRRRDRSALSRGKSSTGGPGHSWLSVRDGRVPILARLETRLATGSALPVSMAVLRG